MSAKVPEPATSKYAAEGTEAHACLEVILKNHAQKPYTISKVLERSHPKAMVNHALRAYEEIVRDLDSESELLCETRVDLGFVAPDMFGTVDAAIVNYLGNLKVYDFKYGAGFVVEAKDNPQLIYYALGLAYKYDFLFEEVTLSIIQPRGFHKAGPIREFTMSVHALRLWEERFRRGVEAAMKPRAKMVSGYWCKFCPAKNICPEYATRHTKNEESDFTELLNERI